MARPKPSVYLDTNILSMLFYRGSNLHSWGWHIETREWWEVERPHFRVFGSQTLIDELANGIFAGQEQALATAYRLPWLPNVKEIPACAAQLVDQGIVPASKEGDALQLAFALVHVVDYLLTWNQAHFANVEIQAKLNGLCKRKGWRAPWLASPSNMPKVSLGQCIRREHEEPH